MIEKTIEVKVLNMEKFVMKSDPELAVFVTAVVTIHINGEFYMLHKGEFYFRNPIDGNSSHFATLIKEAYE